MGWLDRMFQARKKLLETDEPERAFAPDPESDVWPLAVGATNENVFAQIRQQGVSLVRVPTGESVTLSEFAPGVLLFGTMWDTYSAKTIGGMKQSVDAGQVASFGVVFFENSRGDVAEVKRSSWYFPHALVLDQPSASLRAQIGRVPFRVFVGPSGQVERIQEGKA